MKARESTALHAARAVNQGLPEHGSIPCRVGSTATARAARCLNQRFVLPARQLWQTKNYRHSSSASRTTAVPPGFCALGSEGIVSKAPGLAVSLGPNRSLGGKSGPVRSCQKGRCSASGPTHAGALGSRSITLLA